MYKEIQKRNRYIAISIYIYQYRYISTTKERCELLLNKQSITST